MSAENHLDFSLDSGSLLIRSLMTNTDHALARAQYQLAKSDGYGFVVRAAQVLLGKEAPTAGQKLRHMAYCAAGAITVCAFIRSNAPERMRELALRHPALDSTPEEWPAYEYGERLKIYEGFAGEGHNAHPEFRTHAVRVMDHFEEKAPSDDEIVRIAWCGSGYTIYKLDEAWRQANELIDEECSDELGDFDWDNLLT